MVFETTSVEVVQGKMQQAREWGMRYVNQTREAFGVDVQMTAPVNPGPGQAYRLGVILTFDSLAEWADFRQKALLSEERRALVREAFEEEQYFVANSDSRSLFRTL